MMEVARIDDETVSAEALITHLKLSGEFPDLMRRFIRHRIAVLAAKEKGLAPSPSEIQAAADDYRRCFGLHRARQTQEWLDRSGVREADFESYIEDLVYSKKLTETIVNEQAIDAHYRANAPKFETIDIRRMVVDGEGKAMEIAAILKETPERFSELARDHSKDAAAREEGGRINGLTRAMLPGNLAARVFSADEGDVIGPVSHGDDGYHEIIRIVRKHPAKLDEETREKISRTLREDWLAERMAAHDISF
jgi:parvulin-like peptidyl-prolyl isomerase